MATEIKAIKCPQCGSSQKTEIRPRYYRCTSCQTEYFLDDDRQIVEHEVTYRPPAAPVARPATVLSLPAKILIGLGVGAAMLVTAWPRHPANPGVSAAAQVSVQDDYYNDVEKTAALTGTAQQPLVLVLARRAYREASEAGQNGGYATFYDPATQKVVATQRLTSGTAGAAASDFTADSRILSDGQLYVIINKAILYRVNRDGPQLVEVGPQLFGRQPALRAGLATVQFGSDTYGDQLVLLTNDGKNRFYYPLVNRLYTEDELDDADDGLENLLPGATTKAGFTFTDPGIICKDATIKLFATKYLDNGGGPKNIAQNVSCSQRDLGYDDKTLTMKYANVDMGSNDYYRITAARDLTPGRLYFKPEVLWADARQVFITTHATAAEDAPLNLQALDVATGQVRWTTPLPRTHEIHALVPCQGGFVGIGYASAGILVSSEGKLLNQFNFDK